MAQTPLPGRRKGAYQSDPASQPAEIERRATACGLWRMAAHHRASCRVLAILFISQHGHAVTPCPPAPAGYVLSADMDHGGDELRCPAGNDIDAAKAECDRAAPCMAFNIVLSTPDGIPRRCSKRVAAPLLPAEGICFYTKQNTAPQPLGGLGRMCSRWVGWVRMRSHAM